MNETTKTLLQKIQEKKTLDMISKEMDIRESTLQARVESLIHEGYLAEITYGSGCKMCPMSCSSDTCNTDIKMLSLTKKGMNIIDTV
jgi:hypothetical protein